MNLLMAVMGFYPAVSWGGPVTVVQQMGAELQRRGHRLTVVASNLYNKHRRIAQGYFHQSVDGIEVHYLPIYNIPQWPGTLGPTFLPAKSKQVLQEQVRAADMVHVHTIRNAIAIQSIHAATANNKPVILQPHGTLDQAVNSIWLKKSYDFFFMRRLLKQVTAFIALQESEAFQIERAGGHTSRIHIIPNGIASNAYTGTKGKFRAKYGIAPEKKVILFLGRINAKKGTDLLVRAFAHLPFSVRQNWKLVIAGPDDGQLSEVKTLIAKYGLGNDVILPGLLSGETIWDAYTDADLFVLPCRMDTFPMTIVEACQARLPMVITETCEIADILDEKVARIVPVSVDAIAQGIVEVMNNPVLRTQYQEGAKELMQTTFSISAVGDKLENLYEQVLYAHKSA